MPTLSKQTSTPLPVVPDFMELRICPKTNLSDCFDPYLGLVYGVLPGKPIYCAKQGIRYDVEIGQKIDNAAEVDDTDADSSSCLPDMTAAECQKAKLAVEPATTSDDRASETDSPPWPSV
jgi:hypothetical protein